MLAAYTVSIWRESSENSRKLIRGKPTIVNIYFQGKSGEK